MAKTIQKKYKTLAGNGIRPNKNRKITHTWSSLLKGIYKSNREDMELWKRVDRQLCKRTYNKLHS